MDCATVWVYWSVPAALLVRFRGDVFGEALSVNTGSKDQRQKEASKSITS